MTPDFIDSWPYIIYATPSFLIFAVVMLVGASVLPLCLALVSTVEWGLERRKVNRARGQDESDARFSYGFRRFSTTDLGSGIAIACLAVPVAMAVAYATFAWYWAWTLPGLATVLCAHWWLRLRKDGVRNAEVYAIAVWIAPHIVWATITLAISPFTGGKLLPFFHQDVRAESMLGAILGGPLALAVATGAAIATVAVSLILAGRQRDLNSLLVLCLSLIIPCVVYWWFAQPFGFAHLGFTLVVGGYAISKETRRLRVVHDGALNSGSETRLTQHLSVGVMLLLASAVLWMYVPYLSDIGQTDDSGVLGMVLMQIIAVGSLGLLALMVLIFIPAIARRGGVTLDYGAAVLGLSALLLLALAFHLPLYDEFPQRWTLAQWAAATVTCVAVVSVMWSVFGPGALTSREQDQSAMLGHTP